MIARFLAASLAASCVLAAGRVLAADSQAPAASQDPKRDDAYIVTLQAIGAVAPSFPGSSVARPYPFPGVAVRGVGEPERFGAPDDGFGVPVFDADGARLGPVANFVFARGGRDGPGPPCHRPSDHPVPRAAAPTRSRAPARSDKLQR